MNLENEFVPYKQSMELKELGFNEFCFGYYNNAGWFISDYGTDNSNLNKPGMHGKYCSAPLYQQVFRWFRKKENIHYNISTNLTYGYDYTLYFKNKKNINSIFYKTYSKTELACLDNLIKFCKNKKEKSY